MTPTDQAPAEQAPVGITRRSIDVDSLSQAAHLLAEIFPEADHAVIILTPRPRVEVVGTSSEVAVAAAAVMSTLGEDRAPAPLREAEVIAAPDLHTDMAWPQASTALLEQARVGALLGRRLLDGERRIGFLALLSDSAGGLDDIDSARLDTFASIVAGWAVADDAARRSLNLEKALDGARTIGQAIGLVMAERSLLSSEAAAHLKSLSNDSNVKVRDLAAGLLEAHEAALARGVEVATTVKEAVAAVAPEGVVESVTTTATDAASFVATAASSAVSAVTAVGATVGSTLASTTEKVTDIARSARSRTTDDEPTPSDQADRVDPA